jgi:hypothetical protein
MFYSQKRKTKRKGEATYYNPKCKECSRHKAKQWTKDNPGKRKEIQDRYNAKEHRRQQRIELNERCRDEGIYLEWQRNNKDKLNEYRKSRTQNKTHEISNKEWQECKSFFNNSCAYCGISNKQAKQEQGQYLHKEHVEHNGSNKVDNCVPSCKSCNSKKWTYNFNEWYNNDNEVFSEERYQRIIEWIKKF